jgi:hypothetical protein
MIYILLNALPILLATLAGLGAGWAWHRAGGPPTRALVTGFVAQAWFASILAGALILAPALAVTLRHRGLGWRAVGAETGYWLVVMLVQAAVLKMVGLVPPPV